MEEPKIPAGEQITPLPKPRHVLDADGYKVNLCPFCYGFGFLTKMNDRMDDNEDVVCSNCKGSGRYMIRYEPKRLEFSEKQPPKATLPCGHRSQGGDR